MVLFEGERGRKLVGDLPASKWELGRGTRPPGTPSTTSTPPSSRDP